MKADEARAIANVWAQLLLCPKELIKKDAPDAAVTPIELFRLSKMFLQGVNTQTRDQILRDEMQAHINAVLGFVDDPAGLEEYLFSLIMATGDEAGDFQEAISQIEALIATPRDKQVFIRDVIEEMFEKPPRGRPSEFDPATDVVRFLDLTSRLMRICDALLRLRRQFLKKPLGDLLTFLDAEDPAGVLLLRKHDAYLPDLIQELADLRIQKHKTKVQKFADAIAGKELFNWSCAYSLQRAAEFRRAKKKAESE
jgi:hypothetical protein